MAFKPGMMVDLCMAYMLMLVPMALIIMQGHSGPGEKQNQHSSKQAMGCFHPRDAQALLSPITPIYHHFPSQST